MLTRFYVSPQIGTGTHDDNYRNKINDYINIRATPPDWFDEIDNSGRHISICCVHATQTAHDLIVTDTQILPISPLYASEEEMATGMETILDSIPNIATIKTTLEDRGISTSWISGSNTLRDAIRYMIRVFVFANIADGKRQVQVRDFVQNSLSTRINQVPTAVSNAVKNWMVAKGLATGWITGTTTVRQILHFIVENLGFGVFRLSSQSF